MSRSPRPVFEGAQSFRFDAGLPGQTLQTPGLLLPERRNCGAQGEICHHMGTQIGRNRQQRGLISELRFYHVRSDRSFNLAARAAPAKEHSYARAASAEMRRLLLCCRGLWSGPKWLSRAVGLCRRLRVAPAALRGGSDESLSKFT